MAISVILNDDISVGTTEYSLMALANYDPGAAATTDGVYQLQLGLGDMTVSDELQVRIYEKCRSGDTQRIVHQVNLFGPQSQGYVFPSLVLMHGWDMTLDAIAGTTIVVDVLLWKVA